MVVDLSAADLVAVRLNIMDAAIGMYAGQGVVPELSDLATCVSIFDTYVLKGAEVAIVDAPVEPPSAGTVTPLYDAKRRNPSTV